MYIREVGPAGFPKTFKEWMDEHANLRDMIAEGRGKLEWERKIPDEKLVDLKDLLNTPEFKNNLPKVRPNSVQSPNSIVEFLLRPKILLGRLILFARDKTIQIKKTL